MEGMLLLMMVLLSTTTTLVATTTLAAAATTNTLDASQCERLSLVMLPDKGTPTLSFTHILGLHKSLRAASFANTNGGSRALTIPPLLTDITPTPCINFGRRCPVQFVAWLLENLSSDDMLQTTGSSKKVWEYALTQYTHSQLHSSSSIASPTAVINDDEDIEEGDRDDRHVLAVSMPDRVLSLEEMVGCVVGGLKEDGTPSSTSPDSPPPHHIPPHYDLHDSVQRDNVIKSIQHLRGRVEVLMTADNQPQGGGDTVLGSSPPATLARLLPPYYLHTWSHILGYIGFYRDLILVPVVLAAVCSWVVVWVCHGGSRSLWEWVNAHRNSSDPQDRVNMIATSIKWQRYNLLGSIHRAHIIASLLPLLYCCFIAWYLTAVLGVTSIISLLLTPSSSAAASLLVVGGVGGGVATVVGGGFIVLIGRGISSTVGKYRRLTEAIESPEDH